ncbi:hypothetical protein STAS_26052 [Striga asiatica]|uniref:Uncharacterized protein n=1 Tax=Striga asiatica TaxID=4170 RepID=A0A5A7QUE8_STRAF|nr:hypothetical protein STAS_26052 [Striga asiatica]
MQAQPILPLEHHRPGLIAHGLAMHGSWLGTTAVRRKGIGRCSLKRVDCCLSKNSGVNGCSRTASARLLDRGWRDFRRPGRADEGSDERPEAAAHHGGPLLLFRDGVARLWWIDGRAKIGDWKLGSAAAREFASEERHDGVRHHWRKSAASTTFGRSSSLPRRE